MIADKTIYIVDAKRSPIGKFGGQLANLSAPDIASQVIKKMLLNKEWLQKEINEIIIGNVISAGIGQNPARIAAYKSGINIRIPSFTVNKVCGSSLKSIILGSQAILTEDANVVLTGGMESMSQAPYLIMNHRNGVKLGNQTIVDSMINDGLFCQLTNQSMGMTAERIAKRYHITRQLQDEYSVRSHKKAVKAIDEHKFLDEIIPIKINDYTNMEIDEQPRRNTNIELLSRLKPAFKKKGTVTAGNSSTLNDAASIILLASQRIINKYKVKPLAIIKAYNYIGLDPNFMGMGSYYSIKNILKKVNLTINDIDLWEINEAFACQILAVIRKLDINSNKVNINGGAIALGHPIGASGTRILTTLIYGLKRLKMKYGIASLCIGGGQGVSVLVENIN